MNADVLSAQAAGDWHEAMRRGEASAQEAEFASLVERQARFVFRIAYVVLRSAEDAEDVAQDVFFKLFRSGRWRAMEDERAFLARTAWRVAIGRRGRERRPDSELPEVAADGDDPERLAIREEYRLRIHRLIDALPEKLRQPLALASLGEMTTVEIAKAMGLPEGTVRRRIAEGRQLLKEKLLRLGGERG